MNILTWELLSDLVTWFTIILDAIRGIEEDIGEMVSMTVTGFKSSQAKKEKNHFYFLQNIFKEDKTIDAELLLTWLKKCGLD